MKPTLYWIDGPWPGRLAIAARPRGGDWLADEVQSWREAGLHVVISALTPEEMRDLELEQEADLSRSVGLEFDSYSIPDRGVPASPHKLGEKIRQWERSLNEGKSVAIHCRQGIGRSSLLAACLLQSGGIKPTQVWKSIERARGVPVPDTPEQREWVEKFGRNSSPVIS
ncbi:MAG: hypothetical protein L0Y72_28735 [Gemmataceae bacterium]|nr:hypothetical protein [Gemmataceae bacterium]MCI0743035.1 hypothetical protein [Gemmataceae bacterium]